MLLRFLIHPDCLTRNPECSRVDFSANHDDLVRAWIRYGILCVDGAYLNNSTIISTIRSIKDQEIKNKWMKCIEKGMIRVIGANWTGDISPNELPLISNEAELIIVDGESACLFGLADNEPKKNLSNGSQTSIARIRVAPTHILSHKEDLRDSHVAPGQSALDIWNERFRDIAKATSNRIQIVDRYLAENVVSKNHEDLTNFLAYLSDSITEPREVQIYTAWPEVGRNTKFYAERFQNILHCVSNNVRALRIGFVSSKVFQDRGHDRFVKFDRCLWDLGKGLEIFRHETLKFDCAMAFKSPVPETYRDIISALEADVRHYNGELVLKHNSS